MTTLNGRHPEVAINPAGLPPYGAKKPVVGNRFNEKSDFGFHTLPLPPSKADNDAYKGAIDELIGRIEEKHPIQASHLRIDLERALFSSRESNQRELAVAQSLQQSATDNQKAIDLVNEQIKTEFSKQRKCNRRLRKYRNQLAKSAGGAGLLLLQDQSIDGSGLDKAINQILPSMGQISANVGAFPAEPEKEQPGNAEQYLDKLEKRVPWLIGIFLGTCLATVLYGFRFTALAQMQPAAIIQVVLAIAGATGIEAMLVPTCRNLIVSVFFLIDGKHGVQHHDGKRGLGSVIAVSLLICLVSVISILCCEAAAVIIQRIAQSGMSDGPPPVSPLLIGIAAGTANTALLAFSVTRAVSRQLNRRRRESEQNEYRLQRTALIQDQKMLPVREASNMVLAAYKDVEEAEKRVAHLTELRDQLRNPRPDDVTAAWMDDTKETAVGQLTALYKKVEAIVNALDPIPSKRR